MKYFILAFVILVLPQFTIAQSDNTFTISQIGWSFTPPENFKLLDSSASDIKLSENLTIWKKDLYFKNSANIQTTIACSIMTGNQNEEEWNEMRPTEVKGSYRALTSKYPHLNFDSSTTSIIIDGINFQKFSMLGKENGQIKYTHIQLTKFYKGYKLHFVYMFDDPKIGLEIEKQILNSKFSK